MDIRYGCNERDFKRYTTEEIRGEFLIERLYSPGKITAAYTHVDRMLIMGCMPLQERICLDGRLDAQACFGTSFFLERREIGIFNIGGPGKICADEAEYGLGHLDCLYITRGTREVFFFSDAADNPAKFYMVSAPAHTSCATTLIPFSRAVKRSLGDLSASNKRMLNQFIHPNVLETCQLCMGLTILEPGSVWNTLPAHTHEQRMDIYMYFDLPGGDAVFHIMGDASETRHLVVKNEQAVISPPWSIHCGCGTAHYSFIWAMGGENKTSDSMTTIETRNLR
jgi:4-deoxy-L-threo-5-hexosulose-uronate ketol-isomerase